MKVQKLKNVKGITLVALVITIIVLLLLAGIVMVTLSGENGIFSKVKQAKKAQLESEMKEQLTMGLQELQVEKNGSATLDDVTQEWVNGVISKEYNPEIKEDSSFSGKLMVMTKDKIIGKFMIDSNLNFILMEYNTSNLKFEYTIISRIDNKVKINIAVTDEVNGIKQIDYPEGNPLKVVSGVEKKISIDYEVELEKEYKFVITTGDGDKTEKIVKIDDYFYDVIKTLDNGVVLDNNATKAAYNKTYEATVTVPEDEIITKLIVKMGDTEISTSGNNIVDITTGKIKIEKVTDNIYIVVHSVNKNDKLLLKFDETIEDSCGHITTEEGKITFSDDAINGKSAYFDGKSFIKIKVDENIKLGDNFVIEWWEKPENNGTRFYSMYKGVICGGILLNCYEGKIYASTTSAPGGGNWNIFSGARAFSNNEFNIWTHWKFERNENTWITYKNDEKYWQGNSSATIGFDKDAYYTIGRYRNGDTDYYKGYIDEFKIYSN